MTNLDKIIIGRIKLLGGIRLFFFTHMQIIKICFSLNKSLTGSFFLTAALAAFFLIIFLQFQWKGVYN